MSSSTPVVVDAADSSVGDVAENWENDEATESMEKQLSERFKQVRILQRAQADKEARKEKAVRCQEEAKFNPNLIPTSSVTPAGPGGAPSAPVRILRRPESSDKIREEKYQAQRARAEEAARNQLTPEQKEALYVKLEIGSWDPNTNLTTLKTHKMLLLLAGASPRNRFECLALLIYLWLEQ